MSVARDISGYFLPFFLLSALSCVCSVVFHCANLLSSLFPPLTACGFIAVKSIKKQHLVEVRSMANPPAAVKLALESICLLLGESTTDWKQIRSIIMRENFIPTIVNFSADEIRWLTAGVRSRSVERGHRAPSSDSAQVYLCSFSWYKSSALHSFYMCPWSTKAVMSNTAIFVAIDNNTLYESKLSVLLLCQKSLDIKIMFHEDILLTSYHELNFWLVICIAKNLIWITLKMIFSIFWFFCTLRFQISKYCPIITNHTSMQSCLFSFQMMHKSQFWKIDT